MPPPENELKINDLPFMVFILGIETLSILWCNKKMEADLGYSLESMKAMKAGFLKTILHPDDYPQALMIKDYFMTGGICYKNIARLRKAADRDWTWFYSVIKIQDKDNKEGRIRSLICSLLQMDGIQDIRRAARAFDAITEKPGLNEEVPNENRLTPCELDRKS